MPTFYCNYFFCLALGGPLYLGAPWTLPTLPTPLLRHCISPEYVLIITDDLTLNSTAC